MTLARIRGIITLVNFSITVAVVIVLMYITGDKNVIIRRGWAKLEMFLLGITLKVKGKAHPKARLFLVNHLSLIDILVAEAIHDGDVVWVSKKELENIFFYGHITKAPKNISLDREDARSLVKLIKEAKDRIKSGRDIYMFPEGTRGDSTKLLPFKQGAKILAEKLNLVVQPIIITGTQKIANSKTIESTPGDVHVEFLEAVTDTSDKEWFNKLEVRMNEAYIKLNGNSNDL